MNADSTRSDITISFTCNSNTALLLITLHDLLTDPDNSVAAADNSMWLVDEIAGTLDKVLCIIGEDSDQVSDLVRLVVQYVRQRTKAIKGIEP